MSNGFDVSKKMETNHFPPIQNDAGRHQNKPKFDEASPEALSGIGEVLWKVNFVFAFMLKKWPD